MKKKNNYNHGIVNIYNSLEVKTDFNAKKNVKSIDDMEFIVKLPFAEKSVRQQDHEYFKQTSSKTTMKIVTPLVTMVKNKQKAVINGFLYSITHIDPSKEKDELYIYLEGEREIAK